MIKDCRISGMQYSSLSERGGAKNMHDDFGVLKRVD